jgi:hypothetical protein
MKYQVGHVVKLCYVRENKYALILNIEPVFAYVSIQGGETLWIDINEIIEKVP